MYLRSAAKRLHQLCEEMCALRWKLGDKSAFYFVRDKERLVKRGYEILEEAEQIAQETGLLDRYGSEADARWYATYMSIRVFLIDVQMYG